MQRYYWNVATMIAIACSMSGVASADMISTVASDNATVQPGGPRTGSNGKAFLNIEGSSNGNFASYGVADFSFPAPSTPWVSIDSISIEFTQSNAGFTNNGALLFSIDMRSSLVDIQPGTSPLAFGGGDP